MLYLWNSFISGILFYVYLIAYSWWWFFAIALFVVLSLIETKDVEYMYMDDKREII